MSVNLLTCAYVLPHALSFLPKPFSFSSGLCLELFVMKIVIDRGHFGRTINIDNFECLIMAVESSEGIEQGSEIF